MPPSQPIVSSRLCGFVCRSCLLQLQKTQRPPVPWLTRSVRSNAAAGGSNPMRKSKKKVTIPPPKPAEPKEQDDDDPVIKHFEMGPDGERREVPDEDPGNKNFQEMVNVLVQDLDRDVMEASIGLGISPEEVKEKYGISTRQLEEKFKVKMDANPWEKQEDAEDGLPDIDFEPFTKEDLEEERIANELERMEVPAEPPPEIFSEKYHTDEDFEDMMTEDERTHAAGQRALVERMQYLMDNFDPDTMTDEQKKDLRKQMWSDMEEEESEVKEYPDDEIINPADLEDLNDGETSMDTRETLLMPRPVPDARMHEPGGLVASLKSLFTKKPVQPDKKEEEPSDTVSNEMPVMEPAVPQLPQPEEDFPPNTGVTIPKDRFPSSFRKRISSLNNSLTRASKLLEKNVLGDNIQREAWRSYMLTRQALLKQPDNVSPLTWTLLWDIFERPGAANVGRMEHILRLGRDMTTIGIPPQGRQKTLFIESLFLHGDKNKALEEWQKSETTLGAEDLTRGRYWRLGVKMYSEMGQPEKALKTISNFISSSDNTADIRLLLPVMRAYLAPETPIGLNRAWAVYENLKFRLGTRMRMEDYDEAASMFLDAGMPDHGLQVFVDMMLAAENIKKTENSTPKHAISDLADIPKMSISVMHSKTLKQLPPHFNNKFFFGKWIKKLIGAGNLSGAKRVLDHMRDHGLRADAIHMNGLIGAWYRSGTEKNRILAEEAAWKMIEARLQFVKHRDGEVKFGEDFDEGLRTRWTRGSEGYNSIFLVPQANIETFSILLEQYRKRERKDLTTKVFESLRMARVQPNTFFMNEMIMVHTRSGKTSQAWKDYLFLVNEYRVQPDFNTFQALWHLAKKALDPVTRSSHQGFATCWELFREMVRHHAVLTKKDKLPRDLYDKIILGFGLADDRPGTAVALRTLQMKFGMYPGEHTVRSIILQCTRAGMRNEAGFKPRRLGIDAGTKERISYVAALMADFKRQRNDILISQGVDIMTLDEKGELEEALMLLTHLLRFVAHNQLEAEGKSAPEMSKAAAAWIGVPECDPWAQENQLRPQIAEQ